MLPPPHIGSLVSSYRAASVTMSAPTTAPRPHSTSRGWASRSRPSTGGVTSSRSRQNDASYIVAVIEGRGKARPFCLRSLLTRRRRPRSWNRCCRPLHGASRQHPSGRLSDIRQDHRESPSIPSLCDHRSAYLLQALWGGRPDPLYEPIARVFAGRVCCGDRATRSEVLER